MPAIFASKRPDGTTSLGARLDVSRGRARELLDDYVSRWPATFGMDPLEALTTYPAVEEVSEALVEVVFEGRSDNRSWKDAMVAFMHNLPDDAGEFAGFYDRVGGRMHRGPLC
jgi:hypothetical protein